MNAKIKLFRFKKNDNFVLSKKADNRELFPAFAYIFLSAKKRQKGYRLYRG